MKGRLVLILLLVLAVPAAAQVGSWWVVFSAVDPMTAPPQMMLLGPFENRLACAGAREQLRQQVAPELTRQMRAECRTAVDLARMLLAP